MEAIQYNGSLNPQSFKDTWEKAKQEENLYKQVEIVALGLLTLQGKRSSETTMSGVELYECFINTLHIIDPEAEEIQKATFLQYLSLAANKQGTNIFCDGRRKGYYTQEESQEEEDTPNEETAEACEADMYPAIENWLFGKGYRAKTVAGKRKNGTWGNPDVVGFKVQDFLGKMDVELVSIECKKTWDNWQHWIFEAVSHSRFVDRSYFAFVNRFDEISKQSEELFKYAEYFGVGLLVLEVSSEDYENFKTGTRIDLENAVLREIYAAPLHKPQIDAKYDFLKKLGIQNMTDLLNYCIDVSKTSDH